MPSVFGKGIRFWLESTSHVLHCNAWMRYN